jgi:hypothetical protein
MKLYGFPETQESESVQAPVILAEATLVATPAELRRIAQFLLEEAATMERLGASYSHAHLSDLVPEFQSSPNLIVSSASDHAV